MNGTGVKPQACILLVDDEEEVLSALRRALGVDEYHFILASDPRQLLLLQIILGGSHSLDQGGGKPQPAAAGVE